MRSTHLNDLKIVKIVETKNRMVVAKGWGREGGELPCNVFKGFSLEK
jgi:hypothetical protein